MASAATNDLNEIRVDHIGSLVRPANLRELFSRFDRKQASSEEFAAQDEAIRNVIASQEAHGLQIVADSEFRRHNFQESFSEAVAGFDVPQDTSGYYEKTGQP